LSTYNGSRRRSVRCVDRWDARMKPFLAFVAWAIGGLAVNVTVFSQSGVQAYFAEGNMKILLTGVAGMSGLNVLGMLICFFSCIAHAEDDDVNPTTRRHFLALAAVTIVVAPVHVFLQLA
jgi:hypothetical protein